MVECTQRDGDERSRREDGLNIETRSETKGVGLWGSSLLGLFAERVAEVKRGGRCDSCSS